jgi:hypothetical protein
VGGGDANVGIVLLLTGFADEGLARAVVLEGLDVIVVTIHQGHRAGQVCVRPTITTTIVIVISLVIVLASHKHASLHGGHDSLCVSEQDLSVQTAP